MHSKYLLLAALASSIGMMTACHDDHTTAAPVQTTSQSLDTQQVLQLAQQTSETAAPLAVNGGALTLNDTSETSVPISITAM